MKTKIKTMMITIILLSIITGAVHSEVNILRYKSIGTITAKLSISGSVATVSGKIIPEGSYRTDITVKLQMRESNGLWSTVATWTGSNASGYSSAGGSASITNGETYRTFVVGHVYDSNGNLIDTGIKYMY